MTKKKVGLYIFLFIWVTFLTSIKYNFVAGSRSQLIAYIIMWLIVIVYTVLKVNKYVKSQRRN